MNLTFSGETWFWRGPAPWHFVTVPGSECHALEGLDLGDTVTVRLTVEV